MAESIGAASKDKDSGQSAFQACLHPGEHFRGLNVSLDLLTGDVLLKQGMESGLRLQIHREGHLTAEGLGAKCTALRRRRDRGLRRRRRRDHRCSCPGTLGITPTPSTSVRPG